MYAIKRVRSRQAVLVLSVLIAAALAMSGCGFDEGLMEEEPWEDEERYDELRRNLGAFCSVNLVGVGTLDVEEEYLAQVVACENAAAPMEALKAQAVAARTYAKFISTVEGRALATDVSDQAYVCNNPVEQRHRDAVKATRGQVLTHNGRLIAGFYVAGAIPSAANTCQANASSADPTNTERFVTYNRGRIGANVHPTALGHPANPANRGAKSQNGASCLAGTGWDYQRILRYYYGDDIRLTTLSGACYGNDAGAVGQSGPPQQGGAQTGECRNTEVRPPMVERTEWGARAPVGGFGRHNPNRITIHHTYSHNNPGNPAAAVRFVQNDHLQKGYSDVGYHFLIDAQGTIFRGRPETHVGAHSWGQNPDNLGIALIGIYHLSEAPPQEQLRSTARLVRYLSEKYDIAIDRTRIKGHGERNATACPGHQVMSRFDGILDDARTDALCEEPQRVLEGPEIELQESNAQYRYVRLRGVSEEPAGHNSEMIDGFEVDAIWVEAEGQTLHATAVNSAEGVQNAQNVLGAPDNTSCDNRLATVAGVPEGAELVVDLGANFGAGDILHVTQHTYLPADSDCSPSGMVQIAVSEDGTNWVELTEEARGNWRMTLPVASIRFVEPGAGALLSPNVRLRARTQGPIVRVEYFAEHWELGASTQRSDRFLVTREFNVFGTRLLTAIGFDADDRPVARDEVTVEVVGGFQFLSPRDGGTYSPEMWLKAVATDEEVVRVTYEADGFVFEQSEDRANDFAVRYEFLTQGVRNLVARGYNAAGQEIDSHQISVTIEDRVNIDFISPLPGGWYTPGIWFKVDVDDDRVAKVEYFAEQWPLDSSENRSNDFAVRYEFNTFGQREVRAVAFDEAGNELGERRITITVTDEEGRLPQGTNASTTTGGSSGNTDGSVDTVMAERLATEAGRCSDSTTNPATGARCQNGQGGWSTGQCWGFVWGAMLRAGMTTNGLADQLAAAGPCSPGVFNLSAYGFRCNADANPSVLLSTFGMKRIDVPLAEAPRGAVISWERGCADYNAIHGHIEVSMGNGIACSDFCGPIPSHPSYSSCASVYVPVH